ncbi:hypothetical protein SynBIOSE41_01917 [Synechococcus sp. BIOS-E4-1]|nr:hypothetical protein SynBIOSE41_01917 [Synechococcus sp. BIOS-E4-1]
MHLLLVVPKARAVSFVLTSSNQVEQDICLWIQTPLSKACSSLAWLERSNSLP